MFRVKTGPSSLSVFLGEQCVIRHTQDEPFVRAGKGKWTVKGSGVSDEIVEQAPLTQASYDAGRGVIRFSGGDFSLSFHLSESEGNLVLSPQRSTTGLNRVKLQFPARPDEPVYGGGAQYRSLDLRGRRIPLWVREKRLAERMLPHPAARFRGMGEHPSLYPVPFFLTGRQVWHYFQCQAPVIFDFRPNRSYRVELFDLPASIVIGHAAEPMEALKQATRVLGRQPVVPQWAVDGACIEIQGGAEEMMRVLKSIKESGALVGSMWLRDWTGLRDAGAGKKPFYDWYWNRETYPSLDEVIRELAGRGIRSMAYLNPHFSIEGSQFAEAGMKGYLVKKPQGGNYICDMGGFMAGLLDLTNVSACFWMKEVIKNNILKLGFCGYMADMGNYLPADAVLSSGESPVRMHNRWAALWAALNREAIREAGRTADTVFYTRTGWIDSNAHTMMVSTGEHLAGWGRETGLPSALTASLSLSCSGMGLSHTDCGGNVGFLSRRSRELYLRWLDYAMFTPVLRVVRGAAGAWQYDSDRETLAHFARATRLHRALSGYMRQLVRENALEGHPVMRPMFMQFPGQPAFERVQNQYMLGPELLAAPVLIAHQKKQRLLLPDGHWVHLWTGRAYAGGEHTVMAPPGQPPVFYKADCKNEEIFVDITRKFR
ncbi:MAG: alpha-glucosidase [Oscillospiraceae bacterium]|nr:alpha-glucosidase [Oscillospiraceae bacterium]